MSLAEQLSAYTAPFCEPISEASPTGEDVSYDPDFESLKQEIEKLNSVTEGQPNWSNIVSIGEDMLRSRCKDFRLLVWVTVAKFRIGGIKGLVQGLALIRDVTAKFWDTMHPDLKRKRARTNMLAWLSEQAATILGAYEQADLKVGDAEPLGAVEQIYTELDTFYREKLADLYPGMGTLRSVAREKLRLVPVEKKPEPATPAQAPAAATSTATAAAPVAGEQLPAITDAKDADKAVLTLGKTLRSIARILRLADPAQSFSYRLHRVGLWLPVRQLPPVEGGRTRLPPPAPEDRKKLERLHAAGQWMELLEASETASGQYLFWLDPHRYADQAMEQLGALFMQARETVASEVASFVARIKGVHEAKFSDGTPFADPVTEQWLSEHAVGKGGGGGSKAVSEEDQELQRRFEEARELVKKGQVPEGLSLATQLATRGPDARTRFKARLQIAQMALLGGQPRMGRAILAALVGEADQHQLEVWEPTLCAEVYSTQVSCLRAMEPKERAPEDEALLFSKLSRLDPASALRLVGK